jgi:hypothetical protein
VHRNALDFFTRRWIAGLNTAMGATMAFKPMLESTLICSTAYHLIMSKDAFSQEHWPCASQCSGLVHLSLDRRIEYSDGRNHGLQTNAGKQTNMIHCI